MRSPKPPASVDDRRVAGDAHSFAKPCFFEAPNSPVPDHFWLRFGTPKASENRPETGSVTHAKTNFVLQPFFDGFSKVRTSKILQKLIGNRCFCKVGLRGSEPKKCRFQTPFWDPKRVENQSKRRSENGWKTNRMSDAIVVDFRWIRTPKTPLKISKINVEIRHFWPLAPRT